jgi:hypothetical protein
MLPLHRPWRKLPLTVLFLEESELHRLVRSSRPDRLDDRWLSKCRHLFMTALRQSTQDSLPLPRTLLIRHSLARLADFPVQ